MHLVGAQNLAHEQLIASIVTHSSALVRACTLAVFNVVPCWHSVSIGVLSNAACIFARVRRSSPWRRAAPARVMLPCGGCSVL